MDLYRIDHEGVWQHYILIIYGPFDSNIENYNKNSLCFWKVRK